MHQLECRRIEEGKENILSAAYTGTCDKHRNKLDRNELAD